MAASNTNATQSQLAEPPTDIISAVKYAPDAPSKLLVSSWDRHVYLYDMTKPTGELIRKFNLTNPVLDVCFGKDENIAYAAGLDWLVKEINLETGEVTTMSEHEKGVRSVAYDPTHKILVSASWDHTLHIHLTESTESTYKILHVPEKTLSMSISPSKLVLAMADRNNYVYELSALAAAVTQAGDAREIVVEPWQYRESSLKFQTRAVACMPNDQGYATTSIEGRVAVEWFDPSAEVQAKKYAFKCHRKEEDGVDVVYPVHAITFHPSYTTFATGGGDQIVTLWDLSAKRRIKGYKDFTNSVAALAFSPDGQYLAVAVSPGFERGDDEIKPGDVQVQFRKLGDGEAKGPSGKSWE